jgi:hypothetical protein
MPTSARTVRSARRLVAARRLFAGFLWVVALWGTLASAVEPLRADLTHHPEAAAFRAAFLDGTLGWDAVRTRAAAEGEVRWYHWGGSEDLNTWIDLVVAPELADAGVRLESVRVPATRDADDAVLAAAAAGRGLGAGPVDLIWINGDNFRTLVQADLLFGPFAGWTPKFLKMGSFMDLPSSIRPGNLLPMANIGLTEMGLVKYLITELAKNHGARVETLRDFVPSAQDGEWEKVVAGQRVQVIKPNGRGGTLEFGTAVVNAADGSIAGLLGASPGASTAVDAMVDVLQRCFPSRFADWKPALEEMIPSLGRDLAAEEGLFAEQFERSTRTLKLDQRA